MHQVETKVEVTVDGKDLQSAVELANSVIPSRTPMESLKNILLQASDGFMTISAGDSETSVRSTIAAQSSQPIDFAVLGSTLKSILSDCDGDVRVVVTDHSATIYTPVGKFSLPLSSLEGMVPSVGFDSVDYLTTDLHKFRSALSVASRCVSEVKGGATLANIFIDPTNGHVAATDTRRLFVAFIPWEKSGDPHVPDPAKPEHNHVLLSVPACSVVQRLQGSSVDAVFSDNMVVFRAGTTVVSCKMSVGKFPKLSKFLSPPPGSMPSQCEVVAGPLAAVVNRVRVVTTEESRNCVLEFSPTAITAESSSSSLGNAESSMPISLRGPAVSLRLNPQYLLDFLSRVDKADEIRIGLKDFESALFMDVESQKWRYIMIPIVLEDVAN